MNVSHSWAVCFRAYRPKTSKGTNVNFLALSYIEREKGLMAFSGHTSLRNAFTWAQKILRCTGSSSHNGGLFYRGFTGLSLQRKIWCWTPCLFSPFFVAVLTPIEDVDLVIAMCAVSGQLNKTFTLMKDTVKSIVDKYGTSKIHYSVVIYGTQAVPMLGFPSRAVTKEDIKKSINILPKPRGRLFHCLNPKINMHFLYTILHTLPSVLMGRICCTISAFILISIMFD